MDIDEVLAKIDADIERLGRLAEQAGAETAERSAKRFTGRSPDGAVKVVVDGHRDLVRLEIARGAHRGAHPERLAATIMATVNRAKEAVFTKYYNEFLGGGAK